MKSAIGFLVLIAAASVWWLWPRPPKETIDARLEEDARLEYDRQKQTHLTPDEENEIDPRPQGPLEWWE
jgi:hypothetical protein